MPSRAFRVSTFALSGSLLALAACGQNSAISPSSSLLGGQGPLSSASQPTAGLPGSSTMAGQRASALATNSSQSPLFSDDFSDGKSTVWKVASGNWAVCQPYAGAANAYCATSVLGRGNASFAGSSSWTDYAITATVRPSFGSWSGQGRHGLDIIVRAQDPRHFDELELVREADGQQYWEMWQSSSTGYRFLSRGHYSFTSGTTYSVQVTAIGPQFTAAISTDGINFAKLGTATDPAYANGGIGLKTWGGMNAAFGNIVVASTSSTGVPPSPAPAPSGPTVSELPSQADAFVNSVGVDSHFVYSNLAYTTHYPAVSQLLIDSGIKHLRDSGPTYNQTYLNEMAMFGAHGIHHSLGMPINSTPAQVTTALNVFGPSNIDFVEPQNEYDTYAKSDPNWISHLIAEQKMIWSTVRANPAFANVTVLGPALAHNPYYADLGSLDAYEDAGNLHAGFCNYNPGTNNGTVNLTRVTSQIRQSTPSKPIWTTETGYDDNTQVCDAPDATTAAYDPRLIAERWNAGEPRTYFFQFVDTAYGPFGPMGLVKADGTPKPQYTALKSMLGVLSDPGSPFTPTTLNYAVTGQTQNIHHTLLQKRDGTYVLLLWVEKPCLVSIYNPTPVSVPAQQLSLYVPGMTAATQYTYDTSSWTLQPSTPPVNAGTANLTLTDSISFVEFK